VLYSLTASPFRYVAQHVVEGHRFVIGNVVLLLHRMKYFPGPDPATVAVPLPLLSDLKTVDPSDAWVLKASVVLSDGTNANILSAGTTELEKIRDDLKGIVNLVIPERLSMDTRVK
jgi:mediator of RNA polymerase II transcription subunit 18